MIRVMICCLLLSAKTMLALDTLYVDQLQEPFNLAPYAQWTEDEHNALNIKDLTTGKLNDFFTPVKGKMLNAGYSTSAHWLRFQLHNPGSQRKNLVVEIAGPYINELQFFEQTGSGINTYPIRGMDEPITDWRLTNGSFSFTLDLPPNSTHTYYLKARNNVASLRVPLRLWSASAYSNYAQRSHTFNGLFMGIMLLIIFFAVVIFVLLRERLYFMYTLYVTFLLLFMANNKGFLFQTLWPNHPEFNDTATVCVSIITMLMLNRFSQIYLAMQKEWPRLNKVVNVFNILLFGIIVFWFLEPQNSIFRQNLIFLYIGVPIACILIYIFVSISGVLKRQRDPLFYLLALSPILLMTLAIGLRNVNLLPHFDIFEYRIPISFTTEAIIFTFALAYRFKLISDEQERLLLELNASQKQRFRNVIEAVERERKRIAIDLHDGLGQLLSTVKLNVSALEDQIQPEDEQIYDTALNLLDEACTEVREISHNMMPSTLIRMGFLPALKESAAQINKSGKIQVSIHAETYQAYPDESRDVALYRACQELLNNVIKYSGANEVIIKLVQTDSRLFISIKDDGKGFDTELLHSSTGIGWSNIYSRIGMLNGNVEVHSILNEGTTVKIDVPV